MALRRLGAASGFLLTVALLGVVRAQGSGSRDHTGQTPHVAVLGAVESREPSTGLPVAVAFAADDGELVAGTLDHISYPWPERLPQWELAFLPRQEDLRGLTLPAQKRIEIYVRDTDTAETLARVVAHELGHAVDVQWNDSRDRDRWRVARGVGPAVPWWPGDSERDFATLAGDFAEAFAMWQTGAASRSTVGGPLTPEQLVVLAALAS